MSAKKNFLNRRSVDDIDAQDDLVEISKPYVPGPTGRRVHQSIKRIRLLRGGLGSGKTRCGVEHIDEMARTFPGSLYLVGRKDLTSLKVTTQREYEKIVIPETVQDFNVHDGNLYYKNGSVVLFRETKDPKKVLSLELSGFLLDEVDENQDREIIDKIRYRLRQTLEMGGKKYHPPYAGLLCFNPPPKTHWLFDLSQEEDVEDFQFSTYENRDNLPPGYIENLERTLPPWERKRLLDGEWGIEVKGKPVIWGFSEENNVRFIEPKRDLPIIRGWDFGYNHPCMKLAQFDPTAGKNGRYMVFRELMGHREKLSEFAPKVIQMTKANFGGFHVIDYGDPHGADDKDVGETSVDYLWRHHGIRVNHQRQRIKPGLEEIQELVLTRAPMDPTSEKLESCFLVHPSCTLTIEAYCFGYHKDQDGNPVKDGYYDHPVDVDRYLIVGNRDKARIHRVKRNNYRPKNLITGY